MAEFRVSFALSDLDKRSALWRAMADHMRERLQHYRCQNDTSAPAEHTERLRGRIAMLKELLALDEERKPIPD